MDLGRCLVFLLKLLLDGGPEHSIVVNEIFLADPDQRVIHSGRLLPPFQVPLLFPLRVLSRKHDLAVQAVF